MADETPSKVPATYTEMGWRIVYYLMQQGPTTLFLAGILAFLGYAGMKLVPVHMQSIREGYRENALEFKAILQEDRADRKEQFKDMRASFDRATDEFARAVDVLEKK